MGRLCVCMGSTVARPGRDALQRKANYMVYIVSILLFFCQTFCIFREII